MDPKKIYARIKSVGEFPRAWNPVCRSALWLAGAFIGAFLIYPEGLLSPRRTFTSKLGFMLSTQKRRRIAMIHLRF